MSTGDQGGGASPPPPGWSPSPPPGTPPWLAAAPPRPKAGNARTGPLPLHPMTFGDVIDGAVKLFKANARTLLTVTALFVVPVQLLAAFLTRERLGTGMFKVFTDPSGVSTGAGDTGQSLAAIVSVVAAVFVLPFVSGAVSQVVATSYLGGELEPAPALQATRRRFWALIGGFVLVHLCEAAALVVSVVVLVLLAVAGAPALLIVLLAVPAFVVATAGWLATMTFFIAVSPAIVVEELGPLRALRRSAALVRPRFFGVMGVAVLSGILASMLGQVIAAAPSVAGLVLGPHWGGWVLIGIASVLSSLVTTPLIAIVATLVYFDGRIRHEGFDLQVMAADLARGDVVP